MNELDNFLEWHRARVLRRTGSELAPSTLRSMRTRLRTALRAASTSELSVLCHTVTDPEKAEAWLDCLTVTNRPGSLRLVYEVTKSLTTYGRVLGWTDEDIAVAAPAKGPQKTITVYTAEEVTALVSAARGKGLRWWARARGHAPLGAVLNRDTCPAGVVCHRSKRYLPHASRLPWSTA
jgi:hypothetical protein